MVSLTSLVLGYDTCRLDTIIPRSKELEHTKRIGTLHIHPFFRPKCENNPIFQDRCRTSIRPRRTVLRSRSDVYLVVLHSCDPIQHELFSSQYALHISTTSSKPSMAREWTSRHGQMVVFGCANQGQGWAIQGQRWFGRREIWGQCRVSRCETHVPWFLAPRR